MPLRRNPAESTHHLFRPRATVRRRLAALYGGVFLASGVALLTIIYALVDSAGNAVEYTGHWGRPSSVDAGHGGLTQVSCATADFCEALDAEGHALEWTGGQWSAPVLIDTSSGGNTAVFSGMSCASPAFCVAVDANGDSLFFGG